MDCIRKTVSKEGLLGLYAGAASPLLGAMAHNAGVREQLIFCVHFRLNTKLS